MRSELTAHRADTSAQIESIQSKMDRLTHLLERLETSGTVPGSTPPVQNPQNPVQHDEQSGSTGNGQGEHTSDGPPPLHEHQAGGGLG
jgi:hypothetical protein